MLAAATSFFSRTAISQSYNIGAGNASRSSTPTPSGSSSSVSHTSTARIGLWKVQGAVHKVTNKRVSVWSFDKRVEMEGLGPLSRDRVLEVLKAEATALSRLRHPSILGTVDFCSREDDIHLQLSLSKRWSSLWRRRGTNSFSRLSLSFHRLRCRYHRNPVIRRSVELDEIEKGILQLCKGLSFLHSSARLIHTNLKPECIIINDAGDWKISGLGLTIPLTNADGTPTRWEFPGSDARVPSYVQRSFDYIAPEYALDETLVTASDIYSLGALVYAVHCKGKPPFLNYGSLGSLRDNVGRPVPDIGQLDTDLQDLLRSLLTRSPSNRPTSSTLPSHPFFSSLPISTLNFLDRSNFTTKTREEKISFMKGLTGVLNKFSEGLKVRKILPSLLEEMKDTHLLPYILPNVFAISTILSAVQFAQLVLPSLKPLFTVKDPPQNMLTLLDNLDMLQSKTEKVVFRERECEQGNNDFYHSLNANQRSSPLYTMLWKSEHAIESCPIYAKPIDYAEVSGVLFPRVALVFTKTRLLSVKVATLATFLSMVKVLDQINLTQKLCPLLSKIRTKEPAVIMATLSVQEAMGFKIEREAVATLVLPQLWAMSMGPLLNIEQFQRFMSVIRKLGDRVEKEHDQFLRDSQRIEDRSALANGVNLPNLNSGVDFESLVGRANATTRAEVFDDHRKSWDDDVWGPILNGGHEVSTPGISAAIPTPQVSSSQASAPALPAHPQVQSLPSSPRVSAAAPLPRPSRLGAKPVPATSIEKPAFSTSSPLGTISSIGRPMRVSSPPSNPQHGTSFSNSSSAMSKPNYNISFSDVMLPASSTPSASPPINPAPNYNSFMLTNSPSVTTPPSMGSMLMPMQPTKLVAPSKPVTKDDWGDFDPLK
ncbi:kinase-like domain-containing protein [Pisolithus orientalis]|uniref:kinase-like domain-containing protein n=1 Tax=Pisolithus orientalis TaxID=936130 RepID=UPI00222414E3|nr:kinase-like domain-containing protein [Pisolithus orientalis]KAI6019640.1 kinase-like domain-containing protein [Pisolithus orientalis]